VSRPLHVELLAPAGGPRALRAALAAGADAVYFGLERWSARAFAGNFEGDDAVVAAVDLTHLYDARAYVALNTLLKDEEVGPALAALEAPYLAGLDALIVADLGFALEVRRAYPDLPLHASTQAGAHSSSQLQALASLGYSRAVLARELSLPEIAALDAAGLELETFVHGALCYGYSGNCLLSSMVGGRSGNRGRCSQSCRLRYSMSRAGDDAGVHGASALGAPAHGASPRSGAKGPPGATGEGAPAEPSRVMSTSDLAAIDALPQLIAAGVTSLKIEGRMKDAAYVGVTTAIYRHALDAALADPAGYSVRPEWRASLEQSFSRSFTTAHLEGRHHEVRSGGRGGHRGVLVGRVASVDEAAGRVEVRLAQPVAAGDVVYLYTPWGQSEPLRVDEGGEERLVLRVRERVALKDRLFRLAAADVGRLALDLASGRSVLRPVPLRLRLTGCEGEPASLTASIGAPPHELSSAAQTAAPLVAARTAALSEAKALDALGALGGTPYRLESLEYAVDDGVFLAVGEIKDLRRRAVAELDESRLARHRRQPAPRLPAAGRPAAGAQPRPAHAWRGGEGDVVLVVRPGERPLQAVDVRAVCLDVFASDTPEAVSAARRELESLRVPLRLRLPEVLFDADAARWRALLEARWEGVYARHLGVLAALAGSAGPEALLEYPLQGLNGLSPGVAVALAGRPPAAVVASPESSLAEIAGLGSSLSCDAGAAPALEILAFGRQQVLRTRDQLGRAEGLVPELQGDTHAGLVLEDAKGYRFPADVDAGGTRLFNARVTNLAGTLGELREAGVSAFLVVQADLDAAERAAFVAGGLPALAPFASRERSTTGHLFRGVA
jgi:U32 family peptidase